MSLHDATEETAAVQPGGSTMTIRIDNRETKLIDSLTKLLLSVRDDTISPRIFLRVETLSIGDIILTDQDGQDKLIIERKTVPDLLSSIKDGRYEEQSYRLASINIPNHHIIYLIEGEISMAYLDAANKTTAYSSMVSLCYYKGFSVFRSWSVQETAYMIYSMAVKLNRDPCREPFYRTSNESVETSPEASAKDYISLVKRVKKDNINSDNIGEIMLCQIPGISSTTARAILKDYKNLPRLIHQLREDATVIENLTYTNVKGQCRKIGKNVICKLRQYLIDHPS